MYKSIIKIIILTIFLLITVIYIFIYRGRETITNNWSQYRCSPFIIPIAGFFGKNTTENAQKCFFKTFKYFFDFLIKPCQYIIKIIQTILGKLFYDINAFRTFLKPIRIFIMRATQDFYDKVNNFSNTIIYSFAKSRNILKRMAGIFRLTLYSLEVIQFSMKSIWDGPIGKVSRKWPSKFGKIKKFFCFHPKTKLQSNNYLSDICIGNDIGDNNILLGKVIIYEKDIDLYLYNGDLVTGGHLVYENNWKYIKDIPNLKKIKYSGEIICPITSKGIFKSLNYNIYRDFEESRFIDELFLSKTLTKFNIKNNKNYLGECIGVNGDNYYNDTINKKKIKISEIKIGDKINGIKVIGIYKILNTDKYSFIYDNLMIASRQIIFKDSWKLGNQFKKIITPDNSIFYSFITRERYFNLDNIFFLDIFDSENIQEIKKKESLYKKEINLSQI